MLNFKNPLKKKTKELVVEAANAVKEEFKDEIDGFKIIAGVSLVLNIVLIVQNHRLRTPAQTSPVNVIVIPSDRR